MTKSSRAFVLANSYSAPHVVEAATELPNVTPLRSPSATVNLIKAVQDHAVDAIADLTMQIADLTDRAARLTAERETLQKMLAMADDHKDHVQR